MTRARRCGWCSTTAGPPAPGGRDPAFESAVSSAASLAVELLHRGYRVGLSAAGEQLTPEGGPAQTTRILRFLALIEAAAADAPPPHAGRDGRGHSHRPGTPARAGAGRRRVRAAEDCVKFQLTHKLTRTCWCWWRW